ncbi:hypothetical protein HG536_0D00470 [Torulaspora globosa]|uniref:DNA-binding protein RAP1 n=1 Tax=Torulaspora globosa TaxID=48254 RepID=A0A7G3ZG89_9SACH|nr:uncharacterized protein HG536_0D00470 [Torulaspora globosa]QLL32525.1 hypothetical protein HG536_0D00470 [Torulaspora globosa]
MSSPAEFESAPEDFVDTLDENGSRPQGDIEQAVGSQSTGEGQNGGEPKEDGKTADEKARSVIFQDILFYLNRSALRQDPSADVGQLKKLIEERGGKVLNELPGEGVKNAFVVSPYNDTKLPTVTSTYIRACCQNERLLKIENYLVPFDEFRSVIDTELQNEQQNGKGDASYAEAEGRDEQKVSKDDGDQSETATKADALAGPTRVNVALQEPEKQEEAEDTKQKKQGGEILAEIVDQTSAKVDETEGGSDVSSDQTFQTNGVMLSRANLPAHNKASFTEEEDEFILDVVRKNPTRRTTHTLYDEISHYVPNHTGNSIRHRFRVYLSKRLEFVYEVDKYGKLVRDKQGNLIKTKNLPPSIKKKFTAEEDYSLAIGIKKQFYRDLYQVDPDTGTSLISEEDSPTAVAKRNMTMDPNHVPGTEPSFQDYRVNDRRGPIAREFFKQFGENNPTHTENAWRDRFRKFLLAYGIDNYIQYYETEKSQGNEPEPMKNLTNRIKRPGIPTPGNYNSAAKRARNYGSEKESPGGDNTAAASTAAAAVAAASGNTGGNVESGAAQYAIPESDLLDEDTMNFISSLKNDLSKIDNGIPFEYPQEIAEAIRNDFSNEEAIYDNIDPDTIPFPPEIASIDLFLPQFFRMSSTREFLDKLHEVISRDYEPSQAEKLVQDLCDEAGVRKTFSTSILTALSGDLMVFPRYFLNMFKHSSNPPADVPGIWTREDDRMLRSNKEDEIRALIKKHGTGRMEMRKKFVEKDLI